MEKSRRRSTAAELHELLEIRHTPLNLRAGDDSQRAKLRARHRSNAEAEQGEGQGSSPVVAGSALAEALHEAGLGGAADDEEERALQGKFKGLLLLLRLYGAYST